MINWTNDQQKVIDSRNGNVLVSAAAGSGKTAVLVERVIQMILDDKHPIDVDKLVIVTFTNAAAAQMRERIGMAIEDRLSIEPENEHLRKQSTLLHNAQITTIHSFCGYIIKNYFHRIDLDPSYRLSDENETDLIAADVIAEMLEQKYEEADSGFIELVSSPAYDRSDQALEEQILRIHKLAMSDPWSDDWYNRMKASVSIDTVKQLENSQLTLQIIEHIKNMLQEFMELSKQIVMVCETEKELSNYLTVYKAEQEMLKNACQAQTFDELYLAFSRIVFNRLPGGKKSPKVKEISDELKSQRDTIKSEVNDIKAMYFYADPIRQVEVLQKNKECLFTLINLAQEFSHRFAQMKRERNVIDFNDLEHFATQILIKKDEQGNILYTEAADELSEYFEEIIVDEYQDSNLVQETLLKAVSKERLGKPNVFMVGDVKQSIYKFRLAKPELFSEKLMTYKKDEGKYRRIDLHQNFRSRSTVIDATNWICQDIIRKQIGNVVYDEDAALHQGAQYSSPETGDQMTCDVLIVGKDNEQVEDSDAPVLSTKEREAYCVAQKIKQMTDEKTGVYVADQQGVRLAKYSDIVILLRSASGWADVYEKILMENGIPSASDASDGFYKTTEIQTIIAFLRIIDNPLQDIALASTLRSPMFGFNDEELAILRGNRKKRRLFTAINEYVQLTKLPKGEQSLQDKTRSFLECLNGYRERKPYISVYDLLCDIFDTTDYYHYVMTMPGGERRVANLDLLLRKACDFSKTSYQGLYHFMRYLERIVSSEVSAGEANILGDNENLVRIMTIHKSKGLEFPICIVGGLGKKFNRMDNAQWLVTNPDYAIASDYLDQKTRSQKPTLIKQMLKTANDKDLMGEELRIMYVAMTRAKEKLVLVGCVNKLVGARSKWIDSIKMYYSRIMGASTYLDLLMPSVLTCPNALFNVEWVTPESIVTDRVKEEVSYVFSDLLRDEIDQDMMYSQQLHEEIKARDHYTYPFANVEQLPVKLSVSDIKHKYMEDDFAFDHTPVPERKEQSGAQYGTIVHQVMASLPFEYDMDLDQLNEHINTLVSKGNVKAEDAEIVNQRKIETFFHSELGKRMSKAYKANQLYREQPFVFGVPANELEYESDDLILVQGIIDAFFEEDGELVLMDYKTDRLSEGEDERLILRYKAQIDFYEKALKQITGKNVKEKILYSFSLSKEIKV